MHEIHTRRIYETVRSNECRILVDRLWPRGVSKEKADLDLWAKEVTPSDELRKSYHHGLLLKDDFWEKYRKELLESENLESFLLFILETLPTRDVVLLSAVKDLSSSHVPVLKEMLEKRLKESKKK